MVTKTMDRPSTRTAGAPPAPHSAALTVKPPDNLPWQPSALRTTTSQLPAWPAWKLSEQVILVLETTLALVAAVVEQPPAV
jgi:hypothetical protein